MNLPDLILFTFLIFNVNTQVTVTTCDEIQRKPCNESLGFCVPKAQCSDEVKFTYGDKAVNINVRFELEESEGECHYLEKCCDPENIVTKDQVQSQFVESFNENSVDQCVQQCRAVDAPKKPLPPVYVQQNYSSDLTDGVTSRFTSDVCGFRHKRGVGLEHNGNSDVSQFGEFPWQVAISESGDQDTTDYICGGSIIHPSIILTGAHCVREKSASVLRVRAGEWDTQTTNEMFRHSDHEVKQIISHPDFGPKNLTFNVALLVLATPVTISPHINTICLPPQNYKINPKTCFASGWGKDKFGQEGVYRVNLKKVQLPTVPLKTCQDSLRKTKLGSHFKLHTSFMCAGGEKDVDTCVGDGGSPLVCPIDDESDYYFQVGIVSWGIECGKEGVPGVYANVGKFRNWIDEEIENLGFDTKTYAFQS